MDASTVKSMVVGASLTALLMKLWDRYSVSAKESQSIQRSSCVFDPAVLHLVDRSMLQQRYLCGETGLLPDHPVVAIVDDYFSPWESISQQLPTLNQKHSLRGAVDVLPELDATKLLSRNDLQRAYLLLGQLINSYVNGPKVLHWPQPDIAIIASTATHSPISTPQCKSTDAVTSIPKQLARPFATVCKRLGMPLVLCAAGMDLWNWRRQSVPSTTASTASPIAKELLGYTCVSTMTGLSTEVYFHVIPLVINMRFGRDDMLVRIMNAPWHMRRGDRNVILQLLEDLSTMMKECRKVFQAGKSLVDVDEFYNVYRPLLGGFHPDGVRFAGVGGDDDGVLVRCKGPSAGQHVMFMLLDILLSVEHGEATEFRNFQVEMVAEYMPQEHRQLVADLTARICASGTTMRAFATGDVQRMDRKRVPIAGSAVSSLATAYNAALASLRSFRMFHLGVASRYLQHTGTGTGNSSFRDMLHQAVDGVDRAAAAHT
eukprot:m.338878 g.338878  ORF g.338878 m.338878 type:complete len:487 (+) comp20569_c0_seq2:268-1728(+)